jgi:hypothetical protein
MSLKGIQTSANHINHGLQARYFELHGHRTLLRRAHQAEDNGAAVTTEDPPSEE